MMEDAVYDVIDKLYFEKFRRFRIGSKVIHRKYTLGYEMNDVLI